MIFFVITTSVNFCFNMIINYFLYNSRVEVKLKTKKKPVYRRIEKILVNSISIKF